MKVFITSVLLSSALSITALAGEWKQDDIGWWYQNDDGSYTTDTWQNIEGKNYLFDANGYMRTGWIHTVSGKWYYLNPTGEMRYDDLTEMVSHTTSTPMAIAQILIMKVALIVTTSPY